MPSMGAGRGASPAAHVVPVPSSPLFVVVLHRHPPSSSSVVVVVVRRRRRRRRRPSSSSSVVVVVVRASSVCRPRSFVPVARALYNKSDK